MHTPVWSPLPLVSTSAASGLSATAKGPDYLYVCPTYLTRSPEVPERLLEGVSSAPRQAGGAARVPYPKDA